jgi:tellurite resistance protein TehA-like permease
MRETVQPIFKTRLAAVASVGLGAATLALLAAKYLAGHETVQPAVMLPFLGIAVAAVTFCLRK